VALDATAELRGANGAQRAMKLRDFHREPGGTPQTETNLAPGEMIEAIIVPDTPVAQRSYYLKVRDRASFEFALVSAAVAMQSPTARSGCARRSGWCRHQALAPAGGRSSAASQAAERATLREAAAQAGQGAKAASQNGFKLTLLRRTVLRALQTVTS
jgi:xanthine dehydrogenase YagS FAD-binding subunit